GDRRGARGRGVRDRRARAAGVRHRAEELERDLAKIGDWRKAMLMRIAPIVWIFAAIAGLAAAPASAQSWPSRPIRIVVPLPPGGSPDYLARLLSEKLQPVLGQ